MVKDFATSDHVEDRSSDSIGDATLEVWSIMFVGNKQPRGALRKRERFPRGPPCRFDSVTETAPHDQ